MYCIAFINTRLFLRFCKIKITCVRFNELLMTFECLPAPELLYRLYLPSRATRAAAEKSAWALEQIP